MIFKPARQTLRRLPAPRIIGPSDGIRRRGFLPGHFPGGAGAAQAKLTTLTQVLSASDTSGPSFTLPVGIQAGDLIVVWNGASVVGGPPGTVLPSNFTSIINETVSTSRGILSHKIALGTEGGTTLTGMNDSDGGIAIIVFRGNVPISTATPADVDSQGTLNNPTAQTVNASGGTPPLIVFGCYHGGSVSVDPRTMSPAKDGEVGAGTREYLAWKIYNSAPANVSVDMDDESFNILASCYIACS